MKHTHFTVAKLKYRRWLTIDHVELARATDSAQGEGLSVSSYKTGNNAYFPLKSIDSAVTYANSLLKAGGK